MSPPRSLRAGAVAVVTATLVGCGQAGRATSTAPPPTTATVAAAATAATCPSSVGFTGAVADHGTAPAANGTITAADSYFAPTCVSGIKPGAVTLKVTNTGSVLHSFTLPNGSIDRDIAPGQTISVTVTVAKAPFIFYCKYHRTSGMVGALLPSN